MEIDVSQYHLALRLLTALGVSKNVAWQFAQSVSYRRIYEVCKFAQERPHPPGAAVSALKQEWTVPPCSEEEIRASLPQEDGPTLSGKKIVMKTPARLETESQDEYLLRIQERKRRERTQRKSGSEKQG